MKYIDMHCDTLWKLMDLGGKGDFVHNNCDVCLSKLRKADSMAQFFACFVGMTAMPGSSVEEKYEAGYQHALKMIEVFHQQMENNEDENYIDVPPASDISITKTVSKYQYSVGDLVKYSIKVTNNGPDNAENIKVREIMDDNLLLKSFRASAGDFDKVNDIWSLDELGVGKEAILKISVFAAVRM